MPINISKTKTTVIFSGNMWSGLNEIRNNKASEELKYLRMVADKHDRIDKEIDERIEKAGKIYNIFKNRFRIKREMPQNVKTKLISEVIRSTIVFNLQIMDAF